MEEFFGSIGKMLDKITFLPSADVKIALLGVILVIVFFLLALIFVALGKISGLRKKLLSVIEALGVVNKIDENNVEIVYAELRKLPLPVAKGWGLFLERRDDYPSTYIQARDVINDREHAGRNAAGKVFFAVCSAIVWAFAALCAAMISGSGSFKADDLFGTNLMASILVAVLIPVAVFVILWFVLCLIYSKARKKLDAAFASFQDTLDEKVVLAPKEEEPFEEGSLEDVTKKVEDLTDGRMEYEGSEVITVPEPVEEEYVEEPVEEEPAEEELVEEPVEEPVEEEPVAEEPVEEPVEEAPYVPMTPEEEERYLSILTVIVDDAIDDPETTDEDLEEIAVLIAEAKETGFPNEKDQAILEECLYKLADKYYE